VRRLKIQNIKYILSRIINPYLKLANTCFIYFHSQLTVTVRGEKVIKIRQTFPTYKHIKHINNWFLLYIFLYAAFQWWTPSCKRCVVGCSDIKPLKILQQNQQQSLHKLPTAITSSYYTILNYTHTEMHVVPVHINNYRYVANKWLIMQKTFSYIAQWTRIFWKKILRYKSCYPVPCCAASDISRLSW